VLAALKRGADQKGLNLKRRGSVAAAAPRLSAFIHDAAPMPSKKGKDFASKLKPASRFGRHEQVGLAAEAAPASSKSAGAPTSFPDSDHTLSALSADPTGAMACATAP
jgi:hypothetical protein